MNTQPEALRLADHLEREYFVPAAYELRRLYSVNQELLEALKLTDAMLRGANMDSAFVQKKAEAAIAKSTGENK